MNKQGMIDQLQGYNDIGWTNIGLVCFRKEVGETRCSML